MPRMKGMVLTERDRALLGDLGIARYVTASQVHRLIAPGRDKAIASRRLARLCLPLASPGEGAYLKRHEYRRADGLPLPVWTLTPFGRAVAEQVAAGPVAAAPAGVGASFVERALAVNELLLALVLALRKSEAAPLSALAFRWRISDEPLKFQVRDSRLGRSCPALLRPDAILDVPARRRRLFLQAETGLHGLAPAGPREAHALRRVDRYATFFVALADRDRRLTWYRAAFPDDFAPELVLLFQSETRRARVERVVKENIRGIEVRALTFAGAAAALAAVVAPPAPVAASTSATQWRAPTAVRTVAIDADLASRLRRGLRAFVETYNSMRKLIGAHAAACPARFDLTPGPVEELASFSEAIWHEVLGLPRDVPKGRSP